MATWIILLHDLLQGINQVVDTRPSRDKRDRLCAFSKLRHFAMVGSSDGKVQGLCFTHGMIKDVLGDKSWLSPVAKDSNNDADVPIDAGGSLQLKIVVVSKEWW
jgi:hypothetical protein